MTESDALELIKGQWPWISQVLVWLMVARLCLMKWVSPFIQDAITRAMRNVISTPGDEDDRQLISVLTSAPYRAVNITLDAIFSIKLPNMESYRRIKEQAKPTPVPGAVQVGLVLVACVALTGCGANRFQKAIVSSSEVMKASLGGWVDYVEDQKEKGTPVPIEQEEMVVEIFEKYYIAEDMAFAALKGYEANKRGEKTQLEAAIDALYEVRGDIEALILEYTGLDQYTQPKPSQ